VPIEPPRSAGSSGRESVPDLAGAKVGTLRRDGRAEAVVVAEVERGSAAWNHGLRPGDAIVGVNGRRVREVSELVAALRNTGGTLALGVVRGDSTLSLVIRD
jgi:S1-C subfamily serine protease